MKARAEDPRGGAGLPARSRAVAAGPNVSEPHEPLAIVM